MITRLAATAIAVAAVSFTHVPTAAAAPPAFSVLHHERLASLALERRAVPNDAVHPQGRATRLSFLALGRAFDLGLEPNDRLLANLDAARLSGLELYRGTLAGRPGAWARVGVLRGALYALIWDGSELYAVEPASRLAGNLVEGDEGQDASVAFRVSDVQGLFRDEVLAAPMRRGPYAALVDELESADATSGMRRLDLGLIADAEFAEAHPDVEAELLLRANYVDGIFSEQLGLQIEVAETDTRTSDPDRFTSTDPTTLLDSVASYREHSASMRGEALVHLYTGRELDGDVVGIAYLDGVCDASSGAGLTQGSASVFHDALITAHEIGHNLGARHDAEAGSPCESTPPSYLMAPQLSGSDQFSQCSVQHMSATIAHASCLGAAHAGDVRVTLTAADRALLGDEVPVHLSVDSLGTEANANVVVDLQLMGARLTATDDDRDCTVADGELRCAFGAFAAGAHAGVDFSIGGTRTGIVTVQATAYASNDTNPANNVATRAIELTPAVILSVGVQPDAIALGAGDTAPVEVSILNDSALTATDVSIELSSPLEVSDLTLSGATCAAVAGAAPHYRCALPTLRSRESLALHGVVHAPTDIADGSVISGLLSATASSAEPLARAGSNSASVVVRAYSAVVDLASSVTSAPARIQAGTSANIVVELRNLGPDAAADAELEVSFPVGLQIVEAADDRAACHVSGGAVRCALSSFANGEAIEVDLKVVPSAAGDYAWRVAASHAGLDPDSTNDSHQQMLEVTAAGDASHPSSAASGGGGGGGASWLLVALAALGLGRRQLRIRRA